MSMRTVTGAEHCMKLSIKSTHQALAKEQETHNFLAKLHQGKSL